MYEYLDSLLEKAKKKIKVEFNHIGAMGFDELNVTGTKKVTQATFERLLNYNETMYRKAANDAYKKAKEKAVAVGYSEEEKSSLAADWLFTILFAYNLVTGYLYDKEAERKRLRLNEQILTAREFNDRQMFDKSLKRTANLWWTQTQQYGVDVVDAATVQAYEDLGVERVRWITNIDGRECSVCRERNRVIYDIKKVPAKPHYNCRCFLEPVDIEE